MRGLVHAVHVGLEHVAMHAGHAFVVCQIDGQKLAHQMG